MKKIELLNAVTAAAMLMGAAALSGCTAGDETPDSEQQGEKITIQATTEARTYLNGNRTMLGNNGNVLWTAGDKFLIYGATAAGQVAPAEFALTDGANTTSASFTGYAPASDCSSFAAVYGGDRSSAVFASGAVESVNFVHMAIQDYVAGGFAPGVNPMIAVTDDLSQELAFRNVCGILELCITGDKTVSEIRVDAPNMQISGSVSVTPNNMEWTGGPEDNKYTSIWLSEINERLDPTKAKPFDIVMLPGTYENLTITIVNTDGSQCTRTAASPIVIERSAITPVDGLTDEANALVSVSIDEASSNWHDIVVDITKSDECSRFVYMWGTDSYIADWQATNPDASDADMIFAVGSEYTSNQRFRYDTLNFNGESYHFFAIGFDADGNMGDITSCSFTPQFPYDDNLNVTLAAEKVTSDSATIAIDARGDGISVVNLSIYKRTVLDANPEWLIVQTVAFNAQAAIGYVEGENMQHTFNELLPNTEYVVLCIARNDADTKISHMAQTFVTTEARTVSTASISFETTTVEDYQASFSMTCSDNAVQYKAANVTKAAYESYGSSLADIINRDITARDIPADRTLTLTNLSPETEYVLAAIALDADGNYGQLSALHYTTTAIIPGPDSEEYRRFIGTWNMQYDNLWSAEYTPTFTVTIAEDVVGKTYRVSGLAPRGETEAAHMDDTVTAKFINGNICLEAGSEIADNGDYASQNYSFVFTVYRPNGDGQYGLSLSDSLVGRYVDGSIVFSQDKGYILYIFNSQTGNGMGYFGDFGAPGNIRLTKATSGSASTSTEPFVRKDILTPIWR
ncbi:MAG: hypothetical protein J6K28_07520 [Alistipes sp.]|nr:hypothetical protein [Alistipes sp.]